MIGARALFERHLDLRALRGRSRGLVRCPFHEDRSASLSVDLERGLFHCFACGAEGGTRRFAELTGESAPAGRQASGRYESDLQRARRDAMRRERALQARRAEWLPYWLACDAVRHRHKTAHVARTMAARLGPDDHRTWPLLSFAADMERLGFMGEAALDALLADGSIG